MLFCSEVESSTFHQNIDVCAPIPAKYLTVLDMGYSCVCPDILNMDYPIVFWYKFLATVY